MQIDIISPGKFKENPPYLEVFNYYKKRIKMKINLVETKIYNFEKKKKMLFEKKSISKYLFNSDCLVVLDRSGKNLSSQEFSNFLNDSQIEGKKKISFIIGSEQGLDESFKKLDTISLGNQTWPHLLIRVMLIEQIYRAFEISKGTSYHK